jgi:hypothetical protein
MAASGTQKLGSDGAGDWFLGSNVVGFDRRIICGEPYAVNEEDVPTYYAIRKLLGPKLLAQLMLADPYEDWYRLNPPNWRKS